MDPKPAPALDVSEPYAPRARRAGGLLAVAGWRLKSYGVAWRGAPTVPADDPSVAEVVRGALPRPEPAAGRPGVGWIILHRGRGVDYLVLGWWDRENELPVRVWIRDTAERDVAERGAADGDAERRGTAERIARAWRPATTESFCVWDMDVMSHERDAWIRAVLAEGAGDVEAYLSDAAPDLP